MPIFAHHNSRTTYKHKQMKKNPLAEIFGFPAFNESSKSTHYRQNHLCPFGNIVPNCTKDKADDPLGVCSINHEGNCIITCPVRFREDWIIIENAAKFAFPDATKWTSLSEIRLLDGNGQAAGNIDYVVLNCDENGKIMDFASVEVQGVYISGNLRNAFNGYMQKPSCDFEWNGKNYPHPDYLSSSRKRLIPQLLYKGGIMKSWGKKQCVVLQESFYYTLPPLPEVEKEKADIAWFLYDLELSPSDNQYHLILKRTVYTEFNTALQTVIVPKPSRMEDFIERLQNKLDDKQSCAPETHTIIDIIDKE